MSALSARWWARLRTRSTGAGASVLSFARSAGFVIAAQDECLPMRSTCYAAETHLGTVPGCRTTRKIRPVDTPFV